MQHEGRLLGRDKRLQDDGQREPQRVGEQCLLLGVGVLGPR
ncbi:hypothetical protein [Nonomuraea aridisoli]